jgi:hypothetical protein
VEECRNAEGHATVNTSNQTPAQIPGKPGTAFDPSTAEVDTMRTKTFAADQATGQFLIDGQMFDENRIEQKVQLGVLDVSSSNRATCDYLTYSR